MSERRGTALYRRAQSALRQRVATRRAGSYVSSMSDHPDQRIEIDALLHSLPHRYPFLLVDRIIEIERGVRITGVKNVTMDEPFFAGCSGRGDAVMPGLVISFGNSMR